jgi:predicted nucleic acid-binding protein
VLRRYASSSQATAQRCRQALEDWQAFSVHRYPHEPLLPRVWALRDNFTAYDGAYLALAEALDAPLLTRDARFANAQGHDARIELAL